MDLNRLQQLSGITEGKKEDKEKKKPATKVSKCKPGTGGTGCKQKKLNEKSKSEKQARTFAAAAHDKDFAKKVGVDQKVAKEFNKADKGSKLLSNAMKKKKTNEAWENDEFDDSDIILGDEEYDYDDTDEYGLSTCDNCGHDLEFCICDDELSESDEFDDEQLYADTLDHYKSLDDGINTQEEALGIVRQSLESNGYSESQIQSILCRLTDECNDEGVLEIDGDVEDFDNYSVVDTDSDIYDADYDMDTASYGEYADDFDYTDDLYESSKKCDPVSLLSSLNKVTPTTVRNASLIVTSSLIKEGYKADEIKPLIKYVAGISSQVNPVVCKYNQFSVSKAVNEKIEEISDKVKSKKKKCKGKECDKLVEEQNANAIPSIVLALSKAGFDEAQITKILDVLQQGNQVDMSKVEKTDQAQPQDQNQNVPQNQGPTDSQTHREILTDEDESEGGDNVSEKNEFNNGYGNEKYADGNDYFPKGADGPVKKKTGPSGAKQGDNPLQKRMKVDEVYKELIRSYKKHLKS